MKPTDYFATHPVFRYEDFIAAHGAGGLRSRQSSAASLKQHVAAGNLLHVRRGLYATVPRGMDPQTWAPDPYLVASKLANDASLAYHAALQFHGRAYSVWSRFHYLTRKRSRSFSFRGVSFVPVHAPVAVRDRPEMGGGLRMMPHLGGEVRVSTLERAMVDVLDAPEKGGGWEEIWRSLQMVEFFDLDAVVEYTGHLGSALTAARLGFFLEQQREPLMVEEQHLDALVRLAPRQPRYFDATHESGRLIKPWNLIVPERILHQQWGEMP
jgi:predicted transcriptional regulator of viral defense system